MEGGGGGAGGGEFTVGHREKKTMKKKEGERDRANYGQLNYNVMSVDDD